MPTKFIITSDLHESIGKWRDLMRVVEQEKPRFVLVAGDLLPKDGGFNGQRKFFPVLADYLGAMRRSGETTILTFFGNDDFHPLEPLLDDLAAKGLCVNLNGKAHREAGFAFCGMNHVRDYPFGYKHWCVPDGDFITCPVQFCGQGLTLDAKGRWVKLRNLREYLLAKPSLHDRLESLRSQLTPDEVRRSVWLVHNPPANLGMDICYDGRQVGSPKAGRQISTVVVFDNDGDFILADGFHREKAARKARFKSILSEIRVGSRQDALKFALKANHQHGLRRTNADKRKAVELALTEFGTLSDHLISDMCGVAQSFVSNQRHQLNSEFSSSRRLGRDGKVRELPFSGRNGGARLNNSGEVEPLNDMGNQAFLEVAEALAGLEELVQKVLTDHGDKRPAILAAIGKLRSDLLQIEKRIRDGEAE